MAVTVVAGACSGGPGDHAADPGAGGGGPDGSDESTATDATGGERVERSADEVAARIEFPDADTVDISHGELGAIVGPSLANEEFVEGFYLGSPPTDFEAVVLGQLLSARALDAELAAQGGEVTSEDLARGTAVFRSQLAERLIASAEPLDDATRLMADVPYLNFLAELLAREIALGRHLEATAEPGEGDPCIRQIVVETEAAAEAALADLDAGLDFVVVAFEHSTGASAARGGDLGCVPPDTFVAEFAAAVVEAEVGEVVGPLETPFGWHLVRVEGYAVDGARSAQTLLMLRSSAATVTVDDAVGVWDPATAQIVAAGP